MLLIISMIPFKLLIFFIKIKSRRFQWNEHFVYLHEIKVFVFLSTTKFA